MITREKLIKFFHFFEYIASHNNCQKMNHELMHLLKVYEKLKK